MAGPGAMLDRRMSEPLPAPTPPHPPRAWGGNHDPDNLITLCWYHHHVAIHQMGFRIDPDSPTHRRRLIPPQHRTTRRLDQNVIGTRTIRRSETNADPGRRLKDGCGTPHPQPHPLTYDQRATLARVYIGTLPLSSSSPIAAPEGPSDPASGSFRPPGPGPDLPGQPPLELVDYSRVPLLSASAASTPFTNAPLRSVRMFSPTNCFGDHDCSRSIGLIPQFVEAKAQDRPVDHRHALHPPMIRSFVDLVIEFANVLEHACY